MLNRRSVYKLLLGALFAGFVSSVSAAGDAAAGQVKAIPCMGCHGIPGYFSVYPTYHVPRVRGQHPEYVVYALQSYKNGQRQHATMRAQAATLSEQDMADIAVYFSSVSE